MPSLKGHLCQLFWSGSTKWLGCLWVSPINIIDLWVLGETPAFPREALRDQNSKCTVALNKFCMQVIKINMVENTNITQWKWTFFFGRCEMDIDEAPSFRLRAPKVEHWCTQSRHDKQLLEFKASAPAFHLGMMHVVDPQTKQVVNQHRTQKAYKWPHEHK